MLVQVLSCTLHVTLLTEVHVLPDLHAVESVCPPLGGCNSQISLSLSADGDSRVVAL